ncbi:MAG: tetratricopeptide repeat protein [Acidobacteriota bacterium]
MRAALLALIPLAAWTAAATPYRNLSPGVAYVGDAECAGCHAREARSFPRTAMGRSFSTPAAVGSHLSRRPAGGVTFENRKSRRKYQVLVEDGVLEHREIRLDDQGDEAFSDTRPIAFVLGSGDRGQTFLIRQGHRLYQSAVAFRPHRDGWGMAAGFESLERHDFTRPVTGPCLFCHTNHADHIEGTLNEYNIPMFDDQLSIGCERCHGPGALHVLERRTSSPVASAIDTSIVNPRHLEPDLRDQVCFQCHLQGSVRVVKAGRRPFDFRPGLRLSDVFAVFDAQRTSETGNRILVVSHVERLRESRCWEASQGAITCLTCHDPHRTPHGEDARRQFRAACLTCHAVQDCALDAMTRGSSDHPEDCVRCHMSKTPPTDAPHTLFTDHLIARRPEAGRPAAEASRAPVKLVNFFEVDKGSARDLGLAYLILAKADDDPRYGEIGAKLLRQLLPDHPEDINAHRMMVAHDLATGKTASALASLENLVARAPQMAEFRVELGRLYSKMGRQQEALAVVKAAVAEDPDYAPARLTLGDLLRRAGGGEQADEQYREAIRLDPAMAAPRVRLAESSLRRGDEASALTLLRASLVLNPDQVSARVALATWQMRHGRFEEALAELGRALGSARSRGALVAVRFQMARALAGAGRLTEARAQLDRVLTAAPDHARARKLKALLDRNRGDRPD